MKLFLMRDEEDIEQCCANVFLQKLPLSNLASLGAGLRRNREEQESKYNFIINSLLPLSLSCLCSNACGGGESESATECDASDLKGLRSSAGKLFFENAEEEKFSSAVN